MSRRKKTRAEFYQKKSGGKGPVADAEIIFEQEDGPFAGLKLVGFAIWRREKGMFVTFPSKPFMESNTATSSGKQKYFDFLRSSTKDDMETVYRFKDWLLAEYKESRKE